MQKSTVQMRWRTYVVAVRQVAAIRETETHETILGLDESGERGEATRGSRLVYV